MLVYRIVQSTFKNDLSGTGAALFGGRWNSKGLPVLYCSEFISLCLLELIANFDRSSSPLLPSFHLLEIELPDVNILSVNGKDLKRNWQADSHYSRFIGDAFLRENTDLILQVPSAIISEEHNFLINPGHKDFKKIRIVQSRLYRIDSRLVG